VLAETTDRFRRARLLPAYVEIMLDAGELDEARRACDELAEIAKECATGVLDILVSHARGALELAAGNAAEALAPLRRAWREWQALDAPHDAARARVLLGLACRELGDEDGAALELEAARAEFERLGAATDLASLDALTHRRVHRGEHGLTRREREVLALLATGRTNRAIAERLFISHKTVARHVANIFGKLGVSSRAAATAFAYDHHLLQPPA
jgi:DNA-binding NarL/FixJ family response regulator